MIFVTVYSNLCCPISVLTSLISTCINFISTSTMVAHLFLILHILPPSPDAFPVSSRFLILSPQSHYKMFSPPTTPIRLLPFLLHFHSINFTLPFGIILIQWLNFILSMPTFLLLTFCTIIASNPSSNTFSMAFAMFVHLQHSSVHCLSTDSMTLSALPSTTLFLTRIHLVGSM